VAFLFLHEKKKVDRQIEQKEGISIEREEASGATSYT
jgi:hypothetical protein